MAAIRRQDPRGRQLPRLRSRRAAAGGRRASRLRGGEPAVRVAGPHLLLLRLCRLRSRTSRLRPRPAALPPLGARSEDHPSLLLSLIRLSYSFFFFLLIIL